MQAIFQILALTIFLAIVQEGFRHVGKWVLWGLFLLMPLGLTPYWLAVNEFGLFLWIKLYSVCFCVCWGTLLRFSSLGNRTWARSTISLLLAANILEATVLDAIERGLAHDLNAVAGMLLVLTLPYGSNASRIDSAGRCRDLYCETNRSWVAGYTLWNWTFVYLNYPPLIGQHTAVLLAGLVVGAIDPRRWTQARASTLGINLFAMATFNSDVISWMDTSNWSEAGLGIHAAGIALAIAAGCGFLSIRNLSRTNRGSETRDPLAAKYSLSS